MTRDRRAPPPLAPPPSLAPPVVCSGRLANGLEWLHVERADLPLVDVHVVIRGGVEQDPATLSGLTGLTAETMEEGTVTRTGHEIAEGVDRLGATLAIRAGWDATTLALHTLAPRLPEGLELLADVLCNPTFPESEVRRRRDERLASLLQERDEPAALAARAVAQAIYGVDHAYGRSPRGTRASVSRLDPDLLRATHRDRFRADGAFIVSVGAISATAMEAALAVVWGAWEGGAVPSEPVAAAPPPRPCTITLVDRPGAPQSELRLGCVGPPRVAPDHEALIVLNTLVGGSFTSRLNQRLREEKGFTYGARSSFALRRHGGPFVAGAAIATADTAEAVQDAVAEIRRLAAEPVPADELSRARSFVVLGLPRRLETGSAMAAQLAELHLHGLPPTEIASFADRISAVTPADVQDAAARWLTAERFAIVVVGDAASVRGPLADLKLGPVDEVTIDT